MLESATYAGQSAAACRRGARESRGPDIAPGVGAQPRRRFSVVPRRWRSWGRSSIPGLAARRQRIEQSIDGRFRILGVRDAAKHGKRARAGVDDRLRVARIDAPDSEKRLL